EGRAEPGVDPAQGPVRALVGRGDGAPAGAALEEQDQQGIPREHVERRIARATAASEARFIRPGAPPPAQLHSIVRSPRPGRTVTWTLPAATERLPRRMVTLML